MSSEIEKSPQAEIPGLIRTAEGATAFEINDPMVKLVFTYGSFIPGAETFYGTPDEAMQAFISAVEEAAKLHPELVMQYAAWLRDPRLGKGNRSQSPWVLAVLAGLEESRD